MYHRTTMELASYGGIRYYIKGLSPKLLIVSGIHGDEQSIIPVITNYLAGNDLTLPDFLFVPKVSKSAVENNTRINMYGHDLNRKFYDGSDDEEANSIINLLKQYSFDLSLDIHEDTEFYAFYFYDSGELSNKELDKYRGLFTRKQMKLFSGIDDPQDPALHYTVLNGYVPHARSSHPNTLYDGTFFDWVISSNVSKRALTLEIPGKVSGEEKEKIIHLFFTFILQTLF